MNTESLLPLGMNWPRDKVGEIDGVTSFSDAISQFANGGSAQHEHSTLERTLVINEDDRRRIQRFARDNGFTFDPATQMVKQVTGPGAAWLGSSYDGLLLDSVSGSLHGYGVRLSLFYKGDGSSSSVGTKTTLGVVKLGVIRIKLNKVFPQLVLDSNKNDRGILSSVRTSFSAGQRIGLEGDFDTYFDFYAPKGISVSALSVLSPNFMQTIMDSSSAFDVEFFGDELILTTLNPLYTVSVIETLSKALKEQLKYIARLEASWNYVPHVQPFDVLKTDVITSSYVIKLGKRRIPVLYLILFAFTLVFLSTIIFNVISIFTSAVPVCITSGRSADNVEISVRCS